MATTVDKSIPAPVQVAPPLSASALAKLLGGESQDIRFYPLTRSAPWFFETLLRALDPLNLLIREVNGGMQLSDDIWRMAQRDDVASLIHRATRLDRLRGSLPRVTLLVFIAAFIWSLALLSGYDASTPRAALALAVALMILATVLVSVLMARILEAVD